jgi:hypothetical protein
MTAQNETAAGMSPRDGQENQAPEAYDAAEAAVKAPAEVDRFDQWSHEQDVQAWAGRRQLVAERIAHGLSPYVIPDGQRFIGLPHDTARGRALLQLALRRRAAFARGLVLDCRLAHFPIPLITLRRIMRDGLPAEAQRVRNRLYVKTRAWIAAGCPADLPPWAVVEQAEGLR